MRKPNKHFSRRKLLLLAIAVALALMGTAVSGVSAKYVKDAGQTPAVVLAKEFYFSSDLLAENSPAYTLNPGTKEITFELRNHDDDLRYSESEITYTVTVDNGASVSPASGTLTGDQISTATVTLSGLADGQTYTVTAVGDAGYKKTLTATVTVKAPGTKVYKHLESDPSGAFVLLTVWTENVSGNVSIQFPAGLIPDATDSSLASIQNYANGAYAAQTATVGSLGAYSSHTYRFFLQTAYAFPDISAFTVTVNGTEAEAATPK